MRHFYYTYLFEHDNFYQNTVPELEIQFDITTF